jgi:hypothetical protein
METKTITENQKADTKIIKTENNPERSFSKADVSRSSMNILPDYLKNINLQFRAKEINKTKR